MSRSTRNSLQRESTKVENKTNKNKHQAKKVREIKCIYLEMENIMKNSFYWFFWPAIFKNFRIKNYFATQCICLKLQERTGSETPRGSWASFDLRNSQPDAPIAGLLESWDADTVDSANESKRRETRPVKLFGLYPTPSEAEMIERR